MSLGMAEFKAVAGGLGLQLHEPSFLTGILALDGLVDGMHVQIKQWRGEWVHVDFTAFLDPPADLRVTIRPAGLASKIGELLGKHDVEIGDATFDKAFDVNADEPERAKAFLVPSLREVLLAWDRSGARFILTDEAVNLAVVPGAYSTLSVDDIVRDARAAATLARSATDALASVPPSTILRAHVDAWAAYADAHGLAFRASPLRMQGKLAGTPFTAHAVAIADHDHAADVRLDFERPLPWFLRVRPARLFDFMERTGENVHLALGDAAFDHELRVTTNDADRTKAFLDADVRAALLGLHEGHGAVLLDRRSLSVRTKRMPDPTAFEDVTGRVATVAKKLHERAAPYRTGV